MKRQPIFVALLAMAVPCAAQDADVEELLAESNPIIQDQFEAILKSAKSLRSEFDLWSNTEATLKVKALRE